METVEINRRTPKDPTVEVVENSLLVVAAIVVAVVLTFIIFVPILRDPYYATPTTEWTPNGRFNDVVQYDLISYEYGGTGQSSKLG